MEVRGETFEDVMRADYKRRRLKQIRKEKDNSPMEKKKKDRKVDRCLMTARPQRSACG